MQIMGILNATPDSFSDGGRFNNIANGLKQSLAMVKAGADIIDIGGESSRPGAQKVNINEEIKRVVPLIKALRSKSSIDISIDTLKGEVAQEAIKAGANIVNDISGGNDINLLKITAQSKSKYVLMHMRGTPQTMQSEKLTCYQDIIEEINQYFYQRIDKAIEAGIKRKNIIIDPGIGFAKTTQQNIHIIKQLHKFKVHNLPILLGASRKSFIGTITNSDTNNRLGGSVATALIGMLNGANILRVHDVAETKQAVQIAQACNLITNGANNAKK